MHRRAFLKTSLAASAAAALGGGELSAAGSATDARDYYELRAYRLKPGATHALLDGYLEQAFLPALNARGIAAVGVFTELDVDKSAATATTKPDAPVWVLIPHRTLESFVGVSAELNTDDAVLRAGADYLNAPKASPAFDRIDAWLLRGFKGMPRLERPAFSRDRTPTRVFELRTYESFSELKALKKIAMFESGEIALMKELGMSPVFWGQALAGSGLPRLNYITSGPDLATHLANWKKFGTHPTWLKLRSDPQYADAVSSNTSRFLTPAPFSQI